ASLEGIEKGPAGNTALAAAFAIAQEMDQDQMILVQETEYTGAGKHIQPQLAFAKENGIEIVFGDPKDEIPGKNIVLPAHPSMIKVKDMDMAKLRRSLIKNALEMTGKTPTEEDIEYLAKETKTDVEFVKNALNELKK
ncbi:MAG: 2-amino-4-oxopentanoate thiolase subunit OrtB, partial [Proteocatella sp.]